jgi:CheY-like chemotaxis protein
VDSVERALNAMNTHHFDVIVSDIGLADEEDGIALMRLVRARSADRGGRVPALALTACASASDRTQALAAGFQAHVAKPFDPTELVVAVAALLSLQGTARGDDGVDGATHGP